MSKARQLADLGNVYDDGALSNRNMVINGSMAVAQRGTSESPAPSGYLIDRFATFKSGAGTFSVEQSSDAPVGFNKSLLATVTSASTPSGGDYYIIQHPIEGQNLSVLAQGTANAQTSTLSFYVKSSLTGTFSGSLRDNPSGLSYVFEYTIDSANTWERKSVTIAGSTSGTFPTDNTVGARLAFSLGQGTTFATSTVDSWVSGNFHGSTTETDFIANSGATFAITGVQLEVGDTATPFEHRSYGQELALCHRFFYRLHTAAYQVICNVSALDGSNYVGTIPLQTPLRATPTVSDSGGTVFSNESADFDPPWSLQYTSGNNYLALISTNKGTPPNYGVLRGGRSGSISYISFDAEL